MPPSLRVLHLLHSEGYYGVEAVVITLMAEQRKNGLTPIVGSIGSLGTAVERAAEQEGLDVMRLYVRKGLDVAGAARIARMAGHAGIDLIHCHGYKANILMGLLPARVRGIPHVSTIHGWTSRRRLSRLTVYEWADVTLAKRAAAVAVVSQALLGHPRVRALRLRPTVVPNGIACDGGGPSPSHGAAVNPEGKQATGLVLGTVARLSPEKRIDLLIEAAAQAMEAGHDLSLLIIGDGEQRPALERLARSRRIAHRTTFTGYVPDAASHLRRFDVFALSSATEGLPMTLLEAMRSGLPVVATRVGGIPEVLQDGRYGILVPPGDPRALARALAEICRSPDLRARLSRAGRERVASTYSAASMERGYRALYQRVLAA